MQVSQQNAKEQQQEKAAGLTVSNFKANYGATLIKRI